MDLVNLYSLYTLKNKIILRPQVKAKKKELSLTSVHLPTFSLQQLSNYFYKPLVSTVAVKRKLIKLKISFIFLFFIDWRERERWKSETSVFGPIYLRVHWWMLKGALTEGWTHNLGVSGWLSNQLSYLARADKWTF